MRQQAMRVNTFVAASVLEVHLGRLNRDREDAALKRLATQAFGFL
jgi:hypothetical protein